MGLMRASFRSADLAHADFSGADLSRADLSFAQCGGADFSGAKLRDADASGADLRGATLDGVEATGLDLDSAQLDAGVEARRRCARGAGAAGIAEVFARALTPGAAAPFAKGAPMLMHGLVLAGAERHPDRIAFRWVDRDRAWTYAEAADAMRGWPARSPRSACRRATA